MSYGSSSAPMADLDDSSNVGLTPSPSYFPRAQSATRDEGRGSNRRGSPGDYEEGSETWQRTS